jgi:ribonucleoside-diphosphate reductase alpha chain
VPDDLLEIFQTSFQLPATAYLQVASRAQKWVDQAISRNIYLESRDIGGMSELYVDAWRKGVKTTYYLHMKPRHKAEQSTVKVNKAVESGRASSGFGFARRAAAPVAAEATIADGGLRDATPLRSPTAPPAPAEASTNASEVVFEDGFTCPTDPQELLNCEACQ